LSSPYDRIGGDGLRRVIADFYDRVFADAMIGFLFTDKNKQRLIQKEWELAAALLGGPIVYTGRSMAEAHARVPITGGHFDRRLVILEETLEDHGVDPEVRRRWLDHARSLREQLTSDPDAACRQPDE
jgi:truncated hemoglobin YjbI